MAIKRLTMNSEGQFDERDLEKSELPPPMPKPKKRAVKKRKKASISAKKAASPPTTDAIPRSAKVKVTKQATKSFAAGKSAMDHDMIRFECPKCGSSRVGTEETEAMKCGLCAVDMKRSGT